MSTAKKSSDTEKRPSKTAFVQGLPNNTPAKEVVAKAAAEGITISEAYVHTIRSAAKRGAKAKDAKAPAKKAAKKEEAAAAAAPAKAEAPKKKRGKRAGKGGGPSKREFIESLPRETPVSEVIAAAKKAGLSVSSNYVYLLRSAAKKAGGGAAAPAAKDAGAKKAAAATKATVSAVASIARGSSEGRFVDLVAEIGLGRADELLTEFRAKLKTLKLH
jgi:hypothetical protein